MARPSIKLIKALNNTAARLSEGEKYMWGHMGACNCGHLAQELTQYSRAEIHAYSMRGHGDWSEQAEAYCQGTSLPMDFIIADLLREGLMAEDLIHLERLSDKEVLALIPHTQRIQMKHNNRADVVLYLHAWARLLEEKIIAKVRLPEMEVVLEE